MFRLRLIPRTFQWVLLACVSNTMIANFSWADATKLSDVEVFNRCYLKMVRGPIPRTEMPGLVGKTYLDKVRGKTMTGPEACMALLNDTILNANGIAKGLDGQFSSEVAAILKNFHNFHNSWFSAKAFTSLGTFDRTTLIMHDNDEASLYFTRALFAPNTALNSALTANTTLRSIRKVLSGDPLISRWQAKTIGARHETSHPSQMLISYSTGDVANPVGSVSVSDNQLIPSGQLIGVEEQAPIVVPDVIFTPGGPTVLRTHIASQTKNLNIFEHLGGGVLGTPMFIMKNSNLGQNSISGGTGAVTADSKDTIISRRLSARIFADLLCQQLPTLAESDVPDSELNMKSSNGFKQNKSCLQCHTSVDPLAYGFRNLGIYITGPGFNSGDPLSAKGSPIFGVFRFSELAGSNIFAVQKPTGTLRYRDHKNVFVEKQFSSLSELGAALATSDDFYRCVTKRYYQFFTGIDVNLTVRNIPEGKDTALAKYHRDQVDAMATKLKESQNLRLLIKDIVSSDTFRSRHFMSWGAQ